MESVNSTPFWLDLRKEYIDDNFEKLLPYLRQCSTQKSKDGLYLTTISLMRERVTELLDTIAKHPLYDDAKIGEEYHAFNIRLLGAYLLVDANHDLACQAFTAMMMELRLCVPEKFFSTILQTVASRLKQGSIGDYGFSWQDIMELHCEILVYKITQHMKMLSPLTKTLTYSKYGTAMLSQKGLILTCEKPDNAKTLMSQGVDSMQTGIGIALRTTSSMKLKQSKENDLVAMDEFTKDFILAQYKAVPKKEKRILLHYSEGDTAAVRIDSISRDGQISVSTVDERYEVIHGIIRFKRANIIYYYTTDFSRYLHVGDFVKATVTDADKGYFDIEHTFIEFVVEDCRNTFGLGEMMAKAIYKSGNSLVWLNIQGVPIYTPDNSLYHIGSQAIIRIKQYSTDSYYGRISGEIIEPITDDNDPIVEADVQRECVEAFAEATVLPKESLAKKESNETLSPTLLALLVHLLYDYQKVMLKPSERYRFLAIANVIAEMIGDEVSASFLRFNSTYLRILVQFVSREDISKLQLEPEDSYKDATSTLLRLAIVDILKEYGRKDNSEKLAKTITDFQDCIPMLASLARLVQTANSMQGTLSDAAINVIRREIIKTLSIETENDADLEADGDNYLGIESGTQEFKTSMIYPSGGNMQPNETAQNHNVLKGICAFLNSTTGGTLFLGVNDQGYVKGLENDLKFLRYNDIDHYIRYVQDKALQLLGKDSMMYLQRIEPMYDGRVVAIHVEPHPYRVVELNGIAYLRVNAESREMPESTRQELIAKKVFKDKDKAAAISLLQHAFSQKKCVVLHNYSSNNSGSVTNRFVEAYDVRPDDNLVICYDRDKKGIRVFNISRIGYVEIKENEPWLHETEHVKKDVDLFHMTGEKPIHLFLQLDLMARNLLIEEYPRSAEQIASTKDPNMFYLDTHVYSMSGIGRFYIGLAEHIKIIEGPELKLWVKDYISKIS